MIEAQGNMWDYPADYRVITTNGFVKANGECVMGRGCAKEAKTRFPKLAKELGTKIRDEGNKLFYFPSYSLLTFPVKHNWWEKADLRLIKGSAVALAAWLESEPDYAVVVLPRPGCGNGQLSWDEVKPILEPTLDDRFHVITF